MRPSARLCGAALGLWLVAALGWWIGLPATLSWAAGLALCAAALVDALRVWRQGPPRVERALAPMVPVNQPFDGELRLCPGGPGRARGELLELCPAGVDCERPHWPLAFDGGDAEQVVALRFRARARGAARWRAVQWTADSPWRLWHRRVLLPCESELAVYPDYASSRRQLSISSSRSLRELGIHLRPRAGDSQEFHQLRAYQRGDSLRQIDWKATSRKRQLIARQYAEERDQSLVLMLDCGRRMGLQHGHRQLLDEAFDAALMAAEVALRQGDRVALQCFAAQPLYWSGFKRSPADIGAVLSQLYDIHSRAEASDYAAAAQALLPALARRSTIILVTHSRNQGLGGIAEAARVLGRRHAVVVADIADAELRRLLDERPDDFAAALRYSGALEYQGKRLAAQRELRAAGTEALDVPPRALVSALVQAYHRHRGALA